MQITSLFCSRKLRLYFKPFLSLGLGLTLGVILSTLIIPIPDDCPIASKAKPTSKLIEKHHIMVDGRLPEYTPHIIKTDGLPLPTAQGKLVRPRYAATELGIREKLLIAVLSKKSTLGTLGVAWNRTAAHYASKVIFFVNDRTNVQIPNGLTFIPFADNRQEVLMFNVLRYVGEHYAKVFDWFLFVHDDTYVRAEKILDMVSQMSISHDIYMGKPMSPDNENTHCDVSGGFILSNTVMAATYASLDFCLKQQYTGNENTDVGKCILTAGKKPCTDFVQRKRYRSHIRAEVTLNGELEQSEEFRKVLTVSRVKDDVTMYKLHKFFCEHEIEVTKVELEKIKSSIVKMAPLTPNPEEFLSWPIGVEKPSKPETRFDLIRWEYFNETHIFYENDFSNIGALQGAHKLDVQEVLSTTIQRLEEKYDGRIEVVRLVNGYRRFDPMRGMEYLLDVDTRERASGERTSRRVQLLRPLSYVEFVPMPYVTETSRVNLVLPVTSSEKDGVISFLDSYAQVCLESGDNAYLLIVFLKDKAQTSAAKTDDFAVIKSMVAFYESKYRNEARVAWAELVAAPADEFAIADVISQKFASDALIFVCSIGMELSIDLLNRVRMNTIEGMQAFYPIGFWQYKPSLIYKEKPYPTSIEIKQTTGHFDANVYEHAAFFNSDYMLARKQMLSATGGTVDKVKDGSMILFEMFLQFHSLHVFRAVEPALKLRYRERVCVAGSNAEAYHRCLISRSEALASKSQLAMLVFEHQQKVDEAQMNVIHRQNDPNVVQMKPDMLR